MRSALPGQPARLARQGRPGPTGAIGPAGPTGAVGPAGSVGPAGPAGAIGPAGAVGPAGAAGATGPAGSIGPAGPTGTVGPTGPAGPAGAAGATGSAGVSVTATSINNTTGHLLVSLSNGTTVDAGLLPPPLVPVTSTYTASGAITGTDKLSLINAPAGTQAAMTLANGTVDGAMIVIKRYGPGTVTLTAVIDGVSQTVAMNATGTVREAARLRWSAALSSYLSEN